ncbi:hypothetical protein [Usitatibacter palustris]|uniref:Uncharacterized protein n=1 Tax=Usitatibacter palustris TaxID=2732487 RepID=A0A6M4HBW1_9PROT|nr:hypothetical protein [Usitatibacter palustris]QJR16732.1 hypothetical protein DSM104440_03568 [Usitatibacter palustris]
MSSRIGKFVVPMLAMAFAAPALAQPKDWYSDACIVNKGAYAMKATWYDEADLLEEKGKLEIRGKPVLESVMPVGTKSCRKPGRLVAVTSIAGCTGCAKSGKAAFCAKPTDVNSCQTVLVGPGWPSGIAAIFRYPQGDTQIEFSGTAISPKWKFVAVPGPNKP